MLCRLDDTRPPNILQNCFSSSKWFLNPSPHLLCEHTTKMVKIKFCLHNFFSYYDIESVPFQHSFSYLLRSIRSPSQVLQHFLFNRTPLWKIIRTSQNSAFIHFLSISLSLQILWKKRFVISSKIYYNHFHRLTETGAKQLHCLTSTHPSR